MEDLRSVFVWWSWKKCVYFLSCSVHGIKVLNSMSSLSSFQLSVFWLSRCEQRGNSFIGPWKTSSSGNQFVINFCQFRLDKFIWFDSFGANRLKFKFSTNYNGAIPEVFSTGQLTSRHFMFVWEEKFAPKANMECIFFIASPAAVLVLVRQLCKLTPLVYAPWQHFDGPRRLDACRLASFARSASRGCLVRSPKQTNKHTSARKSSADRLPLQCNFCYFELRSWILGWLSELN
jgi:putative component of membrane protein insertase Oxa1/YidC/SpoIIIJ protein YidD